MKQRDIFQTRLGELMGIYPRGNGKFEFNNKQHAVISLGLFEGNIDYPDAGDAQLLDIYIKHKDYTLGFLYYLGHDPAVPEARRMVGDFVFTKHDVQDHRSKDDAVTLWSHWIDSHHLQRVALSDTSFTNEGRIWVPTMIICQNRRKFFILYIVFNKHNTK